jgi:hypothetical protein
MPRHGLLVAPAGPWTDIYIEARFYHPNIV